MVVWLRFSLVNHPASATASMYLYRLLEDTQEVPDGFPPGLGLEGIFLTRLAREFPPVKFDSNGRASYEVAVPADFSGYFCL